MESSLRISDYTMGMDCPNSTDTFPYSSLELLLEAASLVPISHYLLTILFFLSVLLYRFLEIHFLRDLFTGFRGQSVHLTLDSTSEIYQEVGSKCQVLHGRYLATPWLSSPHLQTVFLSLCGRSPVVRYRRQIFETSDGGTIALDWLMNSDVSEPAFQSNNAIHGNGKNPIVIVIPGLTSDSASAYIKHFAFNMAKRGWNVVVSNHRGLGGVSITSDCFYNAGWTEDIRKIVDYLHRQYPEAPLFVVGTSIGANILVKYLGEDGVNSPVAGAAAVCSPWDLLICDRFINRRLVQQCYNKVLAIGLRGYAEMHQSILARLVDWESIKKSYSVREFDDYATRHLGKYETVDAYYRHCSSAGFVGNVMVPLLCISALDDPVCSKEAIPWDECRANENVILATAQHGGHLAFYEGIMAKSIWWVRAVDEFLSVLESSPLMYRKKVQNSSLIESVESSIDQAPCVNIMEDGLVAPVGDDRLTTTAEEDTQEEEEEEHMVESQKNTSTMISGAGESVGAGQDTRLSSDASLPPEPDFREMVSPIKRRMDQISRHGKTSILLLAYIAILTTWPLVGSALLHVFKRKFRNVFLQGLQRR